MYAALDARCDSYFWRFAGQIFQIISYFDVMEKLRDIPNTFHNDDKIWFCKTAGSVINTQLKYWRCM
jgi:hypothetical protein